MAYLNIKRKWQNQPDYPVPIDRSGVGAKVRFVLLGNQGNDLANGVPRGGTVGSTQSTSSGLAYVLPSSGTTWAKREDSLDPYVSGSFSVFWRGVIRADTLQTFLSYGTLAGWEFKSDGWSPGQIRFRLVGVNSGSGPTIGPVGVADGTIHSVSVVYDDAAATATFYLDGVSIGSSGWTKDAAAVTSNVFTVKGDATSPHKMLAVQAFAGKLSVAEIRSLHDSGGLVVFKAPSRKVWIASSSGASGSLATTNANDTSAASGTTTVTGSLARTNANDTSAASGSTTVTGSLARTNANDTSSASGTTTVTGSLATTNANDTISASGAVGSDVTGTVNATNANDTSAASGTTTVTGSVAKTNANDTSAASGTTTVTGSLARTNADDSVSASGAVGSVSGTVDYTNRNDSVAASGEVGANLLQGGDDFPGIVIEKRRKKTLAEQPNLHLQSIIDKAAREVLPITPKPAPTKTLSLKKAVLPITSEPEAVNPVTSINQEVITAEAEKVAALLAQYHEQVKRMEMEEDEELLLLIMGAF
jgi:hypothetical protein